MKKIEMVQTNDGKLFNCREDAELHIVGKICEVLENNLIGIEKKYPWFFDRPNNAAIYNANGNLRCQIQNPWKDGYIFSFAQPSIKYPNLPSVILDYEDNPYDSSFYDLYAVDTKTGELLETRQQIRR